MWIVSVTPGSGAGVMAPSPAHYRPRSPARERGGIPWPHGTPPPPPPTGATRTSSAGPTSRKTNPDREPPGNEDELGGPDSKGRTPTRRSGRRRRGHPRH